jgi:hypothetical protein
MTDFMSTFFGPLDKGYCYYFFIITIVFFTGFVILIANEVLFILQNINKLNFRMLSGGFIILFNMFIAYFVNRLLYSMCVRSLV